MEEKSTLWSKQVMTEQRQCFQKVLALVQKKMDQKGGHKRFKTIQCHSKRDKFSPFVKNKYFYSKLNIRKHRMGAHKRNDPTVHVGKPSTRLFEGAMFRL